MTAAWIASGTVALCIIGLTVLEMLALAVLWQRAGRGVPLAAALPNILAGDFLLLAWWLSRGHWALAAAALAGAGLSHAVDLQRRWR